MQRVMISSRRGGYAAFFATIVVALTLGASPADGARGGKKGGGGPVCKITDQTDVAIYVGGGIGPSSQLWAEALIDFWKTGSRIPGEPGLLNDDGGATWTGDGSLDYVTLTLSEFNACRDDDFAKLELFFMPGGSAYEIQANLGTSGKDRLTRFLDSGGSYVGMCAGGYYAARGYYWKGDDGAPTDNCRNQFCRYEVDGTFSYEAATSDFTVHEWGGVSYHADLLAYGPLAEVLVEGPIEEIAGPWHAQSDPNHPYDSHLVTTDDPAMPWLRAVYWGGATENYIYTDNAPWGTEHAHFAADASGNDDLPFPTDGSLWTLKSVATGTGGAIMISSAHLEASLFHTASTFTDGGMTECQQYNNYTYLIRRMQSQLGAPFAVPDYDAFCAPDRAGEVKETAVLFPSGLAYQNAPRIDTSGGGGGDGGGDGGGGTGSTSISFDDGTLGDFQLEGDGLRPWQANATAACNGAYGAMAGVPGGVDMESFLTLTVPAGVSRVTYRYSYPSALDRGDDFHVIVNGAVRKSYETGSGAQCATDSLPVTPGDELRFKCRSGGNGETCAVDEIVFD
jgi:hypothetical protein